MAFITFTCRLLVYPKSARSAGVKVWSRYTDPRLYITGIVQCLTVRVKLHLFRSHTGAFCSSVTGMGTQWAGMGCSLMQLPDFRESILRSDAALKDTGLVVSRLLMGADDATFEDTVHAFVGLAAIQVNFSYWNSDMFLSYTLGTVGS